jgi:hypothetical protein
MQVHQDQSRVQFAGHIHSAGSIKCRAGDLVPKALKLALD